MIIIVAIPLVGRHFHDHTMIIRVFGAFFLVGKILVIQIPTGVEILLVFFYIV